MTVNGVGKPWHEAGDRQKADESSSVVANARKGISASPAVANNAHSWKVLARHFLDFNMII